MSPTTQRLYRIDLSRFYAGDRIAILPNLMRALFDLLFGRPLASWEDRQEKIGPASGIPVFGLDALSSAAYGPEAALTILIPASAAGLGYITPITLCIVVLLGLVYLSYRQTIAAYPQGGGSYTVAHENLGTRFGLLAAAALMVDYVLNVAVGISAGVGALVSAVPALHPHMLALCLGILLLLTIVNLRGLREAGLVFMLPTYTFVVCLGGVIVWGVAKVILSGGHPSPVVAPPALQPATEAVTAWLLLKAFASGCTAMTGVEAVSNGVQAFRDDVVSSARKTLTVIIAILTAILLGISYLVRAYGIGATPPDSPSYQSILSQLIGAVAGRGVFYFVSIGSILGVLALSANTSFADFPRVCRAVAANRYLPYGFTIRGRRLVYSQGIYVLAFLAAFLLIVFGGVTDRLIPLFAVGAFLAFTLSQAGMVAHWRRQGGNRANQAINAIGAFATGITLLIIVVAKFMEGAWMTLIMIPALVGIMASIGRHYRRIGREIADSAPLSLEHVEPPLVLVPIDDWNKVSKKALRFAMSISEDVRAVHIDAGEKTTSLRQRWDDLTRVSAEQRGRKPPELVVLKSPYRYVVTPILEYALGQEKENPGRRIAVVIAELREKRWYHLFLHNQRGEALTALLVVNGDERIAVVNVPWYVRS
ncbi:MAG TPA: APC family permease [Bryobacteraceae bacterium]|nr:APC family permease [Bryobacteraceae bacterium]